MTIAACSTSSGCVCAKRRLLFVPETNSRLKRRLSENLETLERAGLRRVLRTPGGIDLSSNDYLGLAQHPRLKRAMAEAAWSEGCGSTGSRLLRGERELFSQIERRFAAFK